MKGIMKVGIKCIIIYYNQLSSFILISTVQKCEINKQLKFNNLVTNKEQINFK